MKMRKETGSIYIGDGVLIDNEEFYEILRRSPVVRKDNYD